MSVGDLKTQGNQGKNTTYQLSSLRILADIKNNTGGLLPPGGLATEATLLDILLQAVISNSAEPLRYDFKSITYDAQNNPIKIDYKVGGTYDSGTGVYTGGTLLFTQYIVYDINENVTSMYIEIA